MKVLMIGDVVAKPGRIAVLERIQDLREQYEIDLVLFAQILDALEHSDAPGLCNYISDHEDFHSVV